VAVQVDRGHRSVPPSRGARARAADRATCRDQSARPATLILDFSALLNGQISLRKVEISDLSLTLPEDTDQIRKTWDALRERFEARASGGGNLGGLALHVECIHGHDVTLVRGSTQEILAVGRIHVEGIGKTPTVDFAVELVPWEATWDGELTLSRGDAVPQIAGSFRIHGLRTDSVMDLPEALRFSAEARVGVEGDSRGPRPLRCRSNVRARCRDRAPGSCRRPPRSGTRAAASDRVRARSPRLSDEW